jgi:hypothetical protein
MKQFTVATVAAVLWLLVALAIDRWLLTPYCAACTSALALDLTIKLLAAELRYPSVSVLVLVVLPMIAWAFWLVPWRQLSSASAWRESFSRWAKPLFWVLVAIALTVIFESVYLVVRDQLPAPLRSLAEAFSITARVSVFKDYTPLTLTASLFGLLGLVAGVGLFLAIGAKGIFKRPST